MQAALLLAVLPHCYSESKVSPTQITHVGDPNAASDGNGTGAVGDGPSGLTIQPSIDGSKCLQVQITANSTNVTVGVGVCNGSTAQRWTYVGGALKNVQEKQCLDVADAAAVDANAALTLHPCDTTRPAQAWIVDRSVLYVANNNKPFSMQLDQTPPVENTGVALAAVDFTNKGQNWVLNVTVPGGTGQLTQGFAVSPTAAPTACLDMDGNNLVTNPCANTTSQRWIWLASGLLKSGTTCISLPTGETADGTQPNIVACDPNMDTQWWIATGGELVDTSISKCADAAGNTDPNAPVHIVTCNGAATQQWQMAATPN